MYFDGAIQEMREPVRLPCQHSFCKACVTDKNCTICGRTIECELVEDRVLSYLIDSSREVTEVCANCDQVRNGRCSDQDLSNSNSVDKPHLPPRGANVYAFV